jgi:hypothetical protein
MLLAGHGDADDGGQEAGVDGFGCSEFAGFEFELFGFEDDFGTGVERLGGFLGAVEEAGGGSGVAEGVSGEEDVTGASGERGDGTGAEDFAGSGQEDEAYGLFARCVGEGGNGEEQEENGAFHAVCS